MDEQRPSFDGTILVGDDGSEPAAAALFDGWAERRARSVREGDFRLTVGHVDVLALPHDADAAASLSRP